MDPQKEHKRDSVLINNEEIRTYDFLKANDIAKQASLEVEKFLSELPNTIRVENVEDDPLYREMDIDLIWHFKNQITGLPDKKTIEIKGDRYYKTGNYFFETVSNLQKNTPGCFMYTKADCIFYYFIDAKELHMLPTNKVREWFLENEHKFKESTTSTNSNKGLLYTSKGKKVPRMTVQKNCDIRILNISSFIA